MKHSLVLIVLFLAVQLLNGCDGAHVDVRKISTNPPATTAALPLLEGYWLQSSYKRTHPNEAAKGSRVGGESPDFLLFKFAKKRARLTSVVSRIGEDTCGDDLDFHFAEYGDRSIRVSGTQRCEETSFEVLSLDPQNLQIVNYDTLGGTVVTTFSRIDEASYLGLRTAVGL